MTENPPKIYLYPYAGKGGKNYFKQIGTKQDLALNKIHLTEGMKLHFYCGDSALEPKQHELVFEGTVHFDSDKKEWYAIIDESTYREGNPL